MELSEESPPENPVELPGVDPQENEVDDDDVSPLLQSDHVSDNESDDKDDNSNTNEDPDDPTEIFIKTAAVLR